MEPISSNSEQTKALLKALGLSGKGVTELIIEFRTNKAVSIRVTRWLDRLEGDALAEWAGQFVLVPKDEAGQAHNDGK